MINSDLLTEKLNVLIDPLNAHLPEAVVYLEVESSGFWFVADLTTPIYDSIKGV